jgi:hypothetical protein
MQWTNRLLLVTVLLGPALGGCAFHIGGGSTKTVVEKTTGEELSDLKQARDAGAINDEEYEKLRKALLDR